MTGVVQSFDFYGQIAIGLVLLFFMKSRVIHSQRSIDLIGRYVMEPMFLAIALIQPNGPSRFQQAVRTHNIGIDERIGATD